MPSSWAISPASEATGVLDDDGADAVVFDPVEKLREARPILDRVRSRNSRIVKLGDDLEAAPLGEALDGVPVSFLAVFVVADIGGRTRSVIGQSRHAVLVGSRHNFYPCLVDF